MAKYKAKLNAKKSEDLKKRKKIKETKYRSDTEEEIRRFIIILIIVVVFVVGIYFISKIIVNNRNKIIPEASTTGAINYSVISVGTIFNRPYSDYYVMVYDKNDKNASYYSAIITKYEKNENSSKMYYCDLSNSLNSEYVAKDGISNTQAKSIEDFQFAEITLLQIKNGKIVKYIENIDEIENILQ